MKDYHDKLTSSYDILFNPNLRRLTNKNKSASISSMCRHPDCQPSFDGLFKVSLDELIILQS